jgi:hypothetical protein
MKQKELIIILIKDDLLYQGLINNFNAIGFYSEDYCLNLSETIFRILGIDTDEPLFELYLNKCMRRAKPAIFKNRDLLEKYATEIYGMLIN